MLGGERLSVALHFIPRNPLMGLFDVFLNQLKEANQRVSTYHPVANNHFCSLTMIIRRESHPRKRISSVLPTCRFTSLSPLTPSFDSASLYRPATSTVTSQWRTVHEMVLSPGRRFSWVMSVDWLVSYRHRPGVEWMSEQYSLFTQRMHPVALAGHQIKVVSRSFSG